MSDDDNVLPFPEFIREELAKLGMPFRCYALVNRTPMPVDNPIAWAEEMARREMTKRRTGVDPWRVDETSVGSAWISTVFIGLDHRFSEDGPPILFETMIFGGRLDNFQNRCCTWDEAEAMHAEAVQLVRTGHLKVVK
jgi:hypothetical protein